jgi:hypothetical protein
MTNPTTLATLLPAMRRTRRNSRSRFPLRAVLGTAFAILAAVGLAVVTAGGTYALSNSQQPIAPVATITAGSAALRATALVVPPTPMYPGLTLFAPSTVTNTGTVALSLSGALSAPAAPNALSQNLSVGFAVAPAAGCPASGPLATPPAGATLGSPDLKTAIVIPAGGQVSLCVSISLLPTASAAAQSQTATGLTLTVLGAQS